MDDHLMPMPPAIAKAIIQIKKTVTTLGADQRNDHGKYPYVTVDKFYDIIGRKMASEGLALVIDETAAEVRDGKSGNPWLFTQYSMAFVHESGAMSPPMRRSCALPISGPQAFGAAQSYIEKQFLRQVFKIPTGEQDADAVAPEDTRGHGSPTNNGDGYDRPISTEQRQELMRLVDEVGGADTAKAQATFLKWVSKAVGSTQVDSFASIPASLYPRAVAALETKRREVAAE